MKQKGDLEKEITRLQEPLNMPKRNFNEELSFPRVLIPSIKEMEIETRRLKQKNDEFIAASKYVRWPEENTVQQEIEFKALQKQCEEMTTIAEW